MKILGENIRKLRQARGLTQQQLADIMGASNYTTISKWESGANSPRGGDLVKLSELFNVSVDELLGINDNITLKSDYKYIPTAISAGIQLDVEAITECETITIPDVIMGRYARDENIFITRVNGDSMNKVIPHNSLIAVRPVSLESLKNGDIVVYSCDGEYALKRFYKKGNKLIFRPDSTDVSFTDLVIDLENNESDIRIHGKVVLYIVELD